MPIEIVLGKLGRSGFSVEAVQGSYRGGVWTPDSPVWILTARRNRPRAALRKTT
jgi:hypothetical protein